MCELLAISSRFPVTANFSLMKFAEHGGNTGPHRDGWGIAYYHGNDIQRIREHQAAANSDWVRFIASHLFTSPLMIAHIRRATRGERTLANTQPFARELAGHMHVFAHNGDLPALFDLPSFQPHHYRPLGTTDSELAFCCLMDRLRAVWLNNNDTPSLTQRLAIVTDFAKEICRHGPANFLYSDGEYLYAHAHRRTNPATNQLEAPGLHLLNRRCPTTTSSDTKIHGLSISSEENSLILLASVPLSEEPWQALEEGEIVVLKNGKRIVSPSINKDDTMLL